MCIRDRLNDVLVADDADLGGGGGSGFQFTIQSNSTGISSVTAISLTGQDYTIGDVLSIDDATVGGGGGSGFQYTGEGTNWGMTLRYQDSFFANRRSLSLFSIQISYLAY